MQISPRAILRLNAELRKERRTMALPDQSGRMLFSMPERAYWYWVRRYPELGASDPDVARRAWQKFLRSDEGRPFLVNSREGKREPNGPRGIIVR